MMINLPLYTIESKEQRDGGWAIRATIDSKHRLIQDHVVHQTLIVSGAYWLECIRSVMESINAGSYQISDLVWLSPLVIQQEIHQILFLIQPRSEAFEVNLLVSDKIDALPLARALLKSNEIRHDIPLKTIAVDQLKLQAKAILSRDDIYGEFSRIGFDYGLSYGLIRQLWCSNHWSLSLLDESADNEVYLLDPGKVDAALQTCLGIAYVNKSSEQAHLPFSIKCIKTYGPMSKVRYIYTMLNPAAKIGAAYHLFFLDEQGQVLTFMQDFIGRRPIGK